MKILWITNSILPEAVNLISHKSVEIKQTGSWVYAMACELQKTCSDLELHVASCSKLVKELTTVKGCYITHHVFPYCKGPKVYNRRYESYWKTIKHKVEPDVVHIHGTEFTLGLSYVNACGNDNVIVSVQGLVSQVSKHVYGGLGFWELNRNITVHDFLRHNTYFGMAHDMKRCAKYEIDILKKVKHVIGRTSWDKANVLAINSHLSYHFCNEMLREEFYSDKWSYKECTKHSIFLSQAHYGVKGTHVFLDALSLVVKKYPDTKVIIAGPKMVRYNWVKEHIFSATYGKYLRKKIQKLNLSDNIIFCGPKNASEMKELLLSSNVFVSPSSIENSPNSLGEAQLLGVPCVASYVGGTADFIPNSNCGSLYRYEDYEVLSHLIIEKFETSKQFDNSMETSYASNRHDKKNILSSLINIYKIVLYGNIK